MMTHVALYSRRQEAVHVMPAGDYFAEEAGADAVERGDWQVVAFGGEELCRAEARRWQFGRNVLQYVRGMCATGRAEIARAFVRWLQLRGVEGGA
jgi:hypothetical protein